MPLQTVMAVFPRLGFKISDRLGSIVLSKFSEQTQSLD